MKKAAFWIQIAALIAELMATVLLVTEVYGKMNPDKIIAEAVIIGACMAVIIACAAYRTVAGKK